MSDGITILKPDFYTAKLEAEKLIQRACVTDAAVWVLEIADMIGIDVYEDDLEGKSGVLNFSEPSITVNRSDSENKKRFTTAHELGHFMLHKGKASDKMKKGEQLFRGLIHYATAEEQKMEEEANYFAANLLVPEHLFLNYYERGATIEQLALIFVVSQEVIARRIYELHRGFDE